MTLEELLEAVENDKQIEDWRPLYYENPFVKRRDVLLVHKCYQMNSVAAAFELFYSIFPPLKQYTITADPLALKVNIVVWPDGLSGETEIREEAWADPGQEAKALLMAIIKVQMKINED